MKVEIMELNSCVFVLQILVLRYIKILSIRIKKYKLISQKP